MCIRDSAVPAEIVFVLPNNKNIIMAAEQAVHLSEEKKIVVVPDVYKRQAFCSSSFLKISNTDIGSNSKISTSAPGGEILINIASFVMLYLRAVVCSG